MAECGDEKHEIHCLQWPSFYRPQRSCGQGNIFAPVCYFVHRGVCIPACIAGGIPACLAAGLGGGVYPSMPCSRSRGVGVYPSMPCSRSPGGGGVSQHALRSMSGRYASYWNAFLLMTYFTGPGGHGPRPPPHPLLIHAGFRLTISL